MEGQAQLDASEVVRGTCRTRGSPCTQFSHSARLARMLPSEPNGGMRRASPDPGARAPDPDRPQPEPDDGQHVLDGHRATVPRVDPLGRVVTEQPPALLAVAGTS